MMNNPSATLIGIVGPCSSGKSTLAKRLRALGYEVREIRQEHSGVPTMWLRLTNPDVLIYLDVSVEAAVWREGLSAVPSWWEEERTFRLAHARAHCDLYVDTTVLTPEETFRQVVEFLQYRFDEDVKRET
jgi:chloramphenicol 3-O-phosphotransferase